MSDTNYEKDIFITLLVMIIIQLVYNPSDESDTCGYILYFILAIPAAFNSDGREYMIPKVIHYCWFGNGSIPEGHWLYSIMERLCPDYEIIVWSESNYDAKKNSYMNLSYEREKVGFCTGLCTI